jgi:predicted GIY-YIG superfamily endonuclease
MAKDPAFLFYPGDWIMGTFGMSFEQKGAYIELLMVQFNAGYFTDEDAKVVLNVRYNDVWPAIKRKFIRNGVGYYNERLRAEVEKRKNFTASRRASRLKCDEDTVRLYLIRDIDSGNFKIGSSVNPMRRFSEMVNQKNPAVTIGSRNYELYWYSEIVKREIEKEVHLKFKSKRITGEWFSLSDTDIEYIKLTHGQKNP